MNTQEMREAIQRAPYKQTATASVYALDEIGGMYEVGDAIVCDNGSIVFLLNIRYQNEVIAKERIEAALAQRDAPVQEELSFL